MEQPSVVTPFYLDKSLWIATFTMLCTLVNSKFGTRFDAAEVVGLVLPCVAYIVGNKWASTKKALAVYASQQASQNPTPTAGALNQ